MAQKGTLSNNTSYRIGKQVFIALDFIGIGTTADTTTTIANISLDKNKPIKNVVPSMATSFVSTGINSWIANDGKINIRTSTAISNSIVKVVASFIAT